MKINFLNWESITKDYDATIRIQNNKLEMNDNNGSGFLPISCYQPNEYEIDENGNGYILGIN